MTFLSLNPTTVSGTRLAMAFISFMVALALFMPSAFAENEVKIAYVDLQRALNEVDEGKRVKSQLQAEFDTKQKQLDAKQTEVRDLQKKLEGEEAMLLSENARQQAAMEFQQKMYDLQQLYVSLQSELAQKEAEATKGIFDKMGRIITQIGKEKNYTMVLEKTESSVLYAADSLDITDELIKRYNAN